MSQYTNEIKKIYFLIIFTSTSLSIGRVKFEEMLEYNEENIANKPDIL